MLRRLREIRSRSHQRRLMRLLVEMERAPERFHLVERLAECTGLEGRAYPLLAECQRRGLVEGGWHGEGRDTRYGYRLTAAGRELVAEAAAGPDPRAQRGGEGDAPLPEGGFPHDHPLNTQPEDGHPEDGRTQETPERDATLENR